MLITFGKHYFYKNTLLPKVNIYEKYYKLCSYYNLYKQVQN